MIEKLFAEKATTETIIPQMKADLQGIIFY